MPFADVFIVFQWWSALFLVGVAAYPLTKRLFNSRSGDWYDKGYLFSKAVGMATVSYIVFFFGTLRIIPFTMTSIIIALFEVFTLGLLLHTFSKKSEMKVKRHTRKESLLWTLLKDKKRMQLLVCVFLEEVFFFLALLSWAFVKAHEPDIHGLEKFMDFGFMQTLYNSYFFPAPDMWWSGGLINYYYFGHLVTAVLTKLSGLDLSVTFNLMLATLFALTLTMSFSIGYQLSVISSHMSDVSHKQSDVRWRLRLKALLSGLLTSFLVTFAGNMQTLYAFTKGYTGENVVPFWTIVWSFQEFFSKVGEGINRYWYANATRFIPFTIHEFPSYSFVVSDVHGHVLSIPFVLLAIGILIMVFGQGTQDRTMFQFSLIPRRVGAFKLHTFIRSHILFVGKYGTVRSLQLVFFGFLVGILLMTNALGGPIYGLLFACLLAVYVKFDVKRMYPIMLVAIVSCITVVPFLIHFKSFANGVGVNCPPAFLANTKIGPFLFEGVEKCQKSPLWMMTLLWGFFWFTGVWLFVRKIWNKERYNGNINRILKVFFLYSLVLIIIPEFVYVKDIYPAHFRSNTMFKLGYEAFIMWSIIAAYVIVYFISNLISHIHTKKAQLGHKTLGILFLFCLLPQLFLVSIYPIFSIRSYFGELKTYKGLSGTTWLQRDYPDDYKAILWLRTQIRTGNFIVHNESIIEADGESYTDYNHVSAFSGVPTLVGWAVHEWLWRGTYDTVFPRREEVKTVYVSTDPKEVQAILAKYNVRYVVIGKLEREKYPSLEEGNIASFGRRVFQSGDTALYEMISYR